MDFMNWLRSLATDEAGNFKPLNLLLGTLCLIGFLGAAAIVAAIGMYVSGETAPRAGELATAGSLGLFVCVVCIAVIAFFKS